MACGCPEGYSFNYISGLCEQTLNEPFTPGTDIALIPPICALEENMIKGTLIYPLITTSQFPLTGQNTPSPSFLDVNNTTISSASSIITGALWVGGTTTTGLLNQRGVGLPSTINTWYGASRCITVGVGDVPSFALSAKTAFRLFINGVLAIIYQPSSGKANTQLHIFPISLSPGQYTFRAEALCSASYSCGSPAGTAYGNFLVEVYNNVTPAILSGLSTQSALNPYYITTNASIPVLIAGSAFDTSSNLIFAQYGCPSGYNNACFQGAFTCLVTNTTPFIPCCYNLTNCVTGAITVSGTDLSQYIGHVIKVVEFPGCFIVSSNSDISCTGGVSVTIASPNDIYNDCTSCALIYYQLTDCNGVAATIITTTDFSSDIGSIVKLQGYDGICWIPTVTAAAPSIKVIKSANFASCADCLYVPPTPLPTPPFYEIAPVALKTRSVQPGYDEGHCNVKFIEKINCNFSNQVYSKLLNQKYGVNSCIIDDFDKFFVKKQLLNLNLIDDPNFCHSIETLPPCGVSASLVIFNPIYCTAPSTPNADIELVIGSCNAPTGTNSQISYQ